MAIRARFILEGVSKLVKSSALLGRIPHYPSNNLFLVSEIILTMFFTLTLFAVRL